MSLMTPVAHALPKHLGLLANEGYKVVTVSDLLKISPFEDIDTGAQYLPRLVELDQAGYIIGYKNNTFQPERPLTKGEMLMMSITREEASYYYKQAMDDKDMKQNIKKHPYYIAYLKYGMLDRISQSNDLASSEDVKEFNYEKLGKEIKVGSKKEVSRKEYVQL